MKKKIVVLVIAALTLTTLQGCGQKSEAVAAQSNLTIESSLEAEQADSPDSAISETNISNESDGANQAVGVVEEIKDFMFIIRTENEESLVFDFEKKPEGLNSVTVGDKIVVKYTGTVSEVDPFTGNVLSVEKI